MNPGRVIADVGGVFRRLDSLTLGNFYKGTPFKIDDCGLATVARIATLTRLDVNFNLVTDANCLEALTRLTRLDLSGNYLRDDDSVAAFGRMTALTVLKLCYTSVGASCPHLVHVQELMAGSADDGCERPVVHMPKLTWLSIDDAEIEGASFFEARPNLKHLALTGSHADDAAKRSVCRLTSLVHLDIRNETEDWSDADIARLPRRITSLMVTGFPLTGLEQLTTLTFLELEENGETRDMRLEGIAEGLPSLKRLVLQRWSNRRGIARAARMTSLEYLMLERPRSTVLEDRRLLDILAGAAHLKGLLMTIRDSGDHPLFGLPWVRILPYDLRENVRSATAGFAGKESSEILRNLAVLMAVLR
jgi:hypothetical protein